MPVFYNIMERKSLQHPNKPNKYYPVLRSVGLKLEKEVAMLIADETTLNRKEAEMALTQFEKILVRLLLEGHTVQLGDWGTFRLTCHADGSDTVEQVTAANIKNLNIRFMPGREIKEAVARASIVYAERMTL